MASQAMVIDLTALSSDDDDTPDANVSLVQRSSANWAASQAKQRRLSMQVRRLRVLHVASCALAVCGSSSACQLVDTLSTRILPTFPASEGHGQTSFDMLLVTSPMQAALEASAAAAVSAIQLASGGQRRRRPGAAVQSSKIASTSAAAASATGPAAPQRSAAHNAARSGHAAAGSAVAGKRAARATADVQQPGVSGVSSGHGATKAAAAPTHGGAVAGGTRSGDFRLPSCHQRTRLFASFALVPY